MPKRQTKRGDERTPLTGSSDVIVCGASFAGLAVARELSGSGARVLIVDRYEIGERQTSACGIPTDWLRATGLMEAERQRFEELVIHTTGRNARPHCRDGRRVAGPGMGLRLGGPGDALASLRLVRLRR